MNKETVLLTHSHTRCPSVWRSEILQVLLVPGFMAGCCIVRARSVSDVSKIYVYDVLNLVAKCVLPLLVVPDWGLNSVGSFELI